MFIVSDTQNERHRLIRSFLTPDRASIAVILAAVDFEWTMRRAILAFGTRPTKVIREEVFSKFYGGYEHYKDAWNAEVRPRMQLTVSEAIPHWSRLTDSKKGAVRLRGQIVHGSQVSVSTKYATPRVEDWLLASKLLEDMAQKHGKSLYRRIVRLKSWGVSQ